MTHNLIKPGKDDAKTCAKLVYMAGPNVFRYLFGLDEPETLQVLSESFNVPGTSYSKENMLVYADENTTMGLIHMYPVRDAKTLEWNLIRELMRTRFRLAARYMGRGIRLMHGPRLENNELYVNDLAVFPAYRGRGIAAKLLAQAEEEAGAKGLSRVSLFVESDNDRAKRVYERFGFQETERKTFPKKPRQFGLTGFVKMVKEVHPQEGGTPRSAKI